MPKTCVSANDLAVLKLQHKELASENEVLKKRIVELTGQVWMCNIELYSKIAELLRAENAELKRRVAKLEAKNVTLESQIATLQEVTAALQVDVEKLRLDAEYKK